MSAIKLTSPTDPSSHITVLPQGALIQHFQVAGHNIVCSLPTPSLYRTHNVAYFGETIGRVANRIAGAKITGLNGRDYRLHANNGTNCLHGGKEGWGKKGWEDAGQEQRDGCSISSWRYVSEDLDEGFPGKVEARVTYAVGAAPNESHGLVVDVEYEAQLVGGEEVEETVVALTNHSYFNVGSGPTVEGTLADFGTVDHLPVDQNQIPTGTIEPFPDLPAAGEQFHFTASEPQIDHCMIIDRSPSQVPLDTRGRPLRRLITMSHPSTKITLQVESTEPAFQIYTGDAIDIPSLEGAPALKSRAGVAIEPSRYVNAVGVPQWRNMVLLRKGQKFGSKSRYTAWKD